MFYIGPVQCNVVCGCLMALLVVMFWCMHAQALLMRALECAGMARTVLGHPGCPYLTRRLQVIYATLT
jgi:hypothetical protein